MSVQWRHSSVKFSTSEKINLYIISTPSSSHFMVHGAHLIYGLHCEALKALTSKGYLFWWKWMNEDIWVNIYLRSDTYFLLFFASMLLIPIIFDMLQTWCLLRVQITYKTYLDNVYKWIYKYIGVHKHNQQTYINILAYVGIIA